jgi:hypothetical protein
MTSKEVQCLEHDNDDCDGSSDRVVIRTSVCSLCLETLIVIELVTNLEITLLAA